MTDPIVITLSRAPGILPYWKAEYSLGGGTRTFGAWTAGGAVREARRSFQRTLQYLAWYVGVTGSTNPYVADSIARLQVEPKVVRR